MIEALKMLLISCFACIAVQDSKDRMVYWVLYLGAALLCAAIQIKVIGYEVTLVNSGINLGFITIIIFAGLLYARLKMRQPFLNAAMGAGDLLLFVGLCFSFNTIAFVVLFVFSLVFSLVVHQVAKDKKHATVPLAGYISIFFAAIYLISFFIPDQYLFS